MLKIQNNFLIINIKNYDYIEKDLQISDPIESYFVMNIKFWYER